MLHVISARCVARVLHTFAPGPLVQTVRGAVRIVNNAEMRLSMQLLLLLLLLLLLVPCL